MRAHQSYQPPYALIGESAAIRRIVEQIHRAALTDVPVFIAGERGTGKELAARCLHDLSFRRQRPFIRISCPTILPERFERTLFGEGTDTLSGEREDRVGECRQADRGTLFLDEIGDLPPAIQPKLLYAMSGPKISRSASPRGCFPGMRLVSSSSRDLEPQRGGTFRPELFYRINVLTISMPPLRERLSDVPLLLHHFIRVRSGRLDSYAQSIGARLLQMLQSYQWPGNVRELEAVADKCIALGEEEQATFRRKINDENGWLRCAMEMIRSLGIPARCMTQPVDG